MLLAPIAAVRTRVLLNIRMSFHWRYFYYALTAAVVIIAAVNRKRSPDAFDVAIILTILCIITNAVHLNLSHDNYNSLFPIMDFATAAILLWAWRNSFEIWKVGIIVAFVVMGGCHNLYIYRGDISKSARYFYDLKLNLLYLCQLGCTLCGSLWVKQTT